MWAYVVSFPDGVDSVWWSAAGAQARVDCLRADHDARGCRYELDVDEIEVRGDPPWLEHVVGPGSPEADGAECPFLYYTRSGYSANCGHPSHDGCQFDPGCFDTDEYPADKPPPVPDDCPLRERGVLVRTKGES